MITCLLLLSLTVMHFYLDTMKILDNHYPGLIKKSYIVNGNSSYIFFKQVIL